MSARLLGWMVVLAMALWACKGDEEATGPEPIEEPAKEKEEEKGPEPGPEPGPGPGPQPEPEVLCEKGDPSCEVDNFNCIVGYDGDCAPGQICYAGVGAPKGTQGTCTDGQFAEDGTVQTSVAFRGLWQDGQYKRIDTTHAPARERFFGCVEAAVPPPPPDWLGRASATLLVSVHGPNATSAQVLGGPQSPGVQDSAEQLNVTVRGENAGQCTKLEAPEGAQTYLLCNHEGTKLAEAPFDSERQQWWECTFEEGWTGDQTRAPLELKLWTESTQASPWIGSFLVDTMPLELSLEASWRQEQGLGPFLYVRANKAGIPRTEWTSAGATLDEVNYSSLSIFVNDVAMETGWSPDDELFGYYSDYQIKMPRLLSQINTLRIEATVSVKDKAGNVASDVELVFSGKENLTSDY